MASEIWQFAAFLSVAVVAFVLWLNIIYLPGRTLEHRYDGAGPIRRSPVERGRGSAEEEFSQSSSDPTR